MSSASTSPAYSGANCDQCLVFLKQEWKLCAKCGMELSKIVKFDSEQEREMKILVDVMKQQMISSNYHVICITTIQCSFERIISSTSEQNAEIKYIKNKIFCDMIKNKIIQICGNADYINFSYDFGNSGINPMSISVTDDQFIKLKNLNSRILFLNVWVYLGILNNNRYYIISLLFTEKEIEDVLECFQGKNWIIPKMKIQIKNKDMTYDVYSLLTFYNIYKSMIKNWWLDKMVNA